MKAIYKPALAGLVSIVLGVAIAWNALGQQKGENESADIAKVKAASQAFYTASSGLDAAAMDKVWAQESYIVYVGPRSKTIAVGIDAARKEWSPIFADFPIHNISVTTSSIRTDGTLAWEVGAEKAQVTSKTGELLSFETFVTNIYEQKNGAWRMISHHAQMIPR